MGIEAEEEGVMKCPECGYRKDQKEEKVNAGGAVPVFADQSPNFGLYENGGVECPVCKTRRHPLEFMP